LRREDRAISGSSDGAFDQLPQGYLEQAAIDIDMIRSILKYHLIIGVCPSELLVDGLEVTTLSGHILTIAADGMGKFATRSVNGAKFELYDAVAFNVIAHILSQVLMPPADEPVKDDPTPAPPSQDPI
jgi:uncharacterized surface protein with fasciclin (FAS1) repeats